MRLLYSGVILIPFYELILQLLPVGSVSFIDSRIHKLVLSLSIAVLFSLWGIYKNGSPKVCKLILLLVGFVLLNSFICPRYTYMVGHLDITNFWVYKALVKVLIWFLFFQAVYSSKVDEGKMLSIMGWCGFIMACYAVLQHLGYDQFHVGLNPKNVDVNTTTRPYIGGNLGHPTIVSPFIAMLVPVNLILGRRVMAGVMGLAVILTKSYVAIGAMTVGVGFYYAMMNKHVLTVYILSGLLLFSGLVYFSDRLPNGIDSGRFAVWGKIVDDLKEVPFKETNKIYPLTGKGIGSYQNVFTTRYKTRFKQAHNEYLQFMHDNGILGFMLLVYAVGFYILRGAWVGDRLTASFLIISLCAAGTFPWQLGVYQYYTCVILALMLRKDELCEGVTV